MQQKTFFDAAGRMCALLSVLGLLALLGPISAHSAGGRPPSAGQTRDGHAVPALGLSGAAGQGAPGAGEADVLYGAPGGLSAVGSQAWHQDSPGVADAAEANDRLGTALVAGDFNGDGYTDLALGVANEEVGGVSGAGAVNVLYGSAGGLSARGPQGGAGQVWHQDSPDMAGEAGPGDGFGFSLAAGDFDGDGYADLAVGVPGKEVAGLAYAGAVNVLYGSAAGLAAAGNQTWRLESPGIEGEAGLFDTFGDALAAGDFNKDGYADLAVGVPGTGVGSVRRGGAVHVLYGSASGLAAAGNQQWHQDSPDVEDAAEGGDFFGDSLAAGDLNGDGYADLAVGVPYEDVGSAVDAGAVNVLYGSAAGLAAAGNQFWHQDSADSADVAETNDGFGRALCTGDLNGDGYADLIAGVPGEGIGTVKRAGAVNVLYGSSAGLTAAGNQFWHQDSPGVGGAAGEGDSYGAALAAGDLNGDGYADLAVGIPIKEVEGAATGGTPGAGSAPAAGAVNVLYGSAAGLLAAGNQVWRQGQAGLAGTAQGNDFFGAALAAGDLDGDGMADLVIGVPGQARHRAHLPLVVR